MKTSRNISKPKTSGGYALLIVLAMGAVSAVILGAAITRTINTATLNERHNQMLVNLNAAEAATEKVIACMMADYQKGGLSEVNKNLGDYHDKVPDEDSYWGQFEFTDGQGNPGTYVTRVSDTAYVPLQSQFGGLSGWATTYRIISNVRQVAGRFPTHTNAVLKEIQIASIPLFQFAFFYNGLMEFTWASDLTVNGRVHANGDIFYSSSGPITFNAPVTATGTIQKKDSWGPSIGGSGESITFDGVPNYRTNIAHLPLLIGTNNTPANLHKIIEMPPSLAFPPVDEDADSLLGHERFYNKAGIRLLVDDLPPTTDTLVTAVIKFPNSEFGPAVRYWTNFDAPDFIDFTKVFMDQRESNWMKITEIDIGKLSVWINTNEDVAIKHPTNLLYVADRRSTDATTKTAVRLVNGSTLPPGPVDGQNTGFTVATPNPLYVKGDYNKYSKVPAALVSDALTILSTNWNDADSTYGLSYRRATDTTVNAAVITGNVPSLTGNNPFSGGVMNLVRLLEDWGDKDLTLNTSLVNLFESTSATGEFTTAVYNFPRRHFNYDTSFEASGNLPPGTPMLSVLLRARWSTFAPNTISMPEE